MHPAFHFCHLASLLSVLTSQLLLAQTTPGDASQTNVPPEVIRVELRIGDGTRSAYHIGEIVKAKLIFTSTVHTKHWISAERCAEEEIYPVSTPPTVLNGRGAQESAAHAFEGHGGCTNHGFGGEVDLAETPYVDSLTLNRRYLLDIAGSYPLTWSGIAFGQSVSSNTATLTLLPRDPVWEASELARAETLLDGPDGPDSHRYEGCSLLRYLGTPAAALEMARRYGGSQGICGNDFKVSLVNARNRGAVLRILENRFLSPTFYYCVTPGFLETMALISVYQTHPEWYRIVTEAQHPEAESGPPVSRAVQEAELRYTRQIEAKFPHHYCTY